MIMSCGCNNINCQTTTDIYNPCGIKYRPNQAPSGLSGRSINIPNGLNNACLGDCPEISVGMPKIIRSHEVDNHTRTAVFFKDGGCEVIAKGYIPSSQNLTSNGPQREGNPCGEGGEHLESEGMDCPNYIFNRSKAGNP